MLSAILGVLDAAGKRVDATLRAASGMFRPTWLTFSAPFTASAAANGQQETITTVGMPAATSSNAGYMTAAQAAALASLAGSGATTHYEPATTTTANATPATILSVPLSGDGVYRVRFWVGGVSLASGVYETEQIVVVAISGGAIVGGTPKRHTTIGTDLDDMGLGTSTIGVSISGGALVFQATGKSATNIRWQIVGDVSYNAGA